MQQALLQAVKGTKEDPYIINSPKELAKLAKDINSGIADQEYTHNQEYFLLGNDIDLSAHRWIPIGSGTSISSFHSFTGYFDGGNKTISGLYVDESSENLVRDYSVMFPELKSKML